MESDIIIPTYTDSCTQWGFKQKVPRKIHVNTASREEKERFKKEKERYWIIISRAGGFTVVSTDESFFFFDSIVRRVWIKKDERPVVRITGSHQESVFFGSISLEGKQLFRQYDWFDENTFLDYLKQIHRKFPKCYLFLDKAKQHYKSKRVLEYFAIIKIV